MDFFHMDHLPSHSKESAGLINIIIDCSGSFISLK